MKMMMRAEGEEARERTVAGGGRGGKTMTKAAQKSNRVGDIRERFRNDSKLSLTDLK